MPVISRSRHEILNIPHEGEKNIAVFFSHHQNFYNSVSAEGVGKVTEPDRKMKIVNGKLRASPQCCAAACDL